MPVYKSVILNLEPPPYSELPLYYELRWYNETYQNNETLPPKYNTIITNLEVKIPFFVNYVSNFILYNFRFITSLKKKFIFVRNFLNF